MLTKRDLLKTAGFAALTAAAGCAADAGKGGAERPGFFKARDIAEAGFIFGLPIVMNYAVMYEYIVDRKSGQWKAPFNHIFNEARVFTYKDTAIVTPNSDTPYSLLWADLRAEPLVLTIPKIEAKRYFSVQLCDASTYNYGYIGSRTTGNEGGRFMVVGPDWNGPTPPGIRQVFRSASQFSLIIYRTQLFNPADLPNVKRVQAGYRVQTLSAFLKRRPPAPAPKINFPKIDKEMAKTNFFDYLDFALQFIAPQPNETEIRAALARIGIGPGKTMNFKDLSLEDKLEIGLGMKAGDAKVDAAVAAFGTNINGWRIGAAQGDAAFINGDWLLRATGAKLGIYGNDPEEATYPVTRTDLAGQPMDGSKHSYTLTFPADQLPPVNAFWSLTMYDGKTQLLIKNPIDRYLINSPMLPSLKRNPDGSLTLLIQHQSPGPDKESNWLPAPDGPIYLVMRLYWPKAEPPSILPPGKGTWRPPGVVQAS